MVSKSKICELTATVCLSVVLTTTFQLFRMLPLSREPSDVMCKQQRQESTASRFTTNVVQNDNKELESYMFGCHNIHEIEIDGVMGHGVSKRTFMGLHNGSRVAVKMATMLEYNSRRCIEDGLREKINHDCYRFSNMKLMKEIIMSSQIHHGNLMNLLGYCYRSEWMSTDALDTHGLIAVYEFGWAVTPQGMVRWPLERRLRTAWELFDLFHYFDSSPLGSMQFDDLKLQHFMLIDGHVKLTDLDDVTFKEPSCSHRSVCGYNVTCRRGVCSGYNAKLNMHKLNYEFTRYFFPDIYFENVPLLKDAQVKFHQNNISLYEMRNLIKVISDELPELEEKFGPFDKVQYLEFLDDRLK